MQALLILLILPKLVVCKIDNECHYHRHSDGKLADCSNKNLTEVPPLQNDTTILDLSQNKIESILNGSFESLLELKVLDVSQNKIKGVDICSFCKLRHLEKLNMSFNWPNGLDLIRNITYGLQFTNISNVSFSNMEDQNERGKKIFISDIEFARNTSIKVLEISSNMLETIEKGSLKFFPPQLEILDVSDNRPVFDIHVFGIHKLKNLRILYANKLNSYHIIRNPVPNIVVSKNGNTRLNVKYLKSSGIQCLGLPVPPKLEEIYSVDSMFPHYIPQIPVCPNSLRKIILSYNALNRWKGPVNGFSHLEYLDLSVNMCDNISEGFFKNLRSLKHLLVQGNFIGYVIEDRENENNNKTDHPCPWFKSLENLVTLNLSLNHIRKLPRYCFLTLRNLEILDLSENYLTDWELEIRHMPNISVVNLSGNDIDRFPKETMDHLTEVSNRRNVTIDLSGNDLECVCKNIDFLEWIETANIVFVKRNTYICRDKDWERYNLTNVEQIVEVLKRSCADYVYLNTVLSILISCFTLVVLYGIFNRYKWKLSYIYYMTWGRYSLMQDEDMEQFYYDAYISYSEEDHQFAEGELAPNLENLHGLSLYLFERDCKPGHSINATIVDKIEKSRKMILLFNRSYIQDGRCRFELNMANMKQMYRHAAPGSVVLIQLESMPYKDIPLEILSLFKQELNIEYPHDPEANMLFWNRLSNIINRRAEETTF